MAGPASADTPFRVHSSSSMDASRLSRALDAIAAAPSMTLEHTVSRKVPVEFPTRLPCSYSMKEEPRSVDLDSTWVARFRDALGIADTAAFRRSSGHCARDTVRTDEIALKFHFGDDEITGRVSFDRGVVAFRWANSYSPEASLRGRAQSLHQLVALALPGDASLREIKVCNFGPADTVGASTERTITIDEGRLQLEHQVAPKYPKPAIDANREGKVLIQALVGKDGRVKSTVIVKSITMLDA